jgi:hypothetical protein
MSGRPFVITLVALWAVVSAVIGGYQSWLATSSSGSRIALAVGALGGLIGVLLLVTALGLLHTSTWARPSAMLGFALASLVVLVSANIVTNYAIAGVHVTGTVVALVVLLRHGKTFAETEGTPDEISAHVGR